MTMEALFKAIFVGLGVRECEGGVGGKSRSLEVVGPLRIRSRSFLAAAISYVPNSAERRRERRLTEARIGSLCAEGGAEVGLGVRAADRNDGEDSSAECLDWAGVAGDAGRCCVAGGARTGVTGDAGRCSAAGGVLTTAGGGETARLGSGAGSRVGSGMLDVVEDFLTTAGLEGIGS